MDKKTQELGQNYDRAAWFYEKAAKFYSTNQIYKSKKAQLKNIKPGDQVLFLGVGAGEDASMAAQRGANVTCVDISQKMLDAVKRKLDQKELSAEMICQSALDHDRVEHYDVVCANYFLNVFRKPMMQKMLAHAATLLKPDGKFMIADVSLPQGNLISKGFNLAYLKLAMATYWAMGMVPWHENYDYPAYFKENRLSLDEVEYFRFAKIGPVVFQNIVATKLPASA